MDEEWVTLLEFPMYEINDLGEVRNRRSGRPVVPSQNRQGILKVALSNERGRFTRSVAVLVAKVFVYGQNDLFDSLIHVDSDLANCRADNLAWRPRWFAYQYHRQFHNPQQRLLCVDQFGVVGPIVDTTDNTIYSTVLDAAMSNGLLIRDIMACINNHFVLSVFPTGQTFELYRPDEKMESEY